MLNMKRPGSVVPEVIGKHFESHWRYVIAVGRMFWEFSIPTIGLPSPDHSAKAMLRLYSFHAVIELFFLPFEND